MLNNIRIVLSGFDRPRILLNKPVGRSRSPLPRVPDETMGSGWAPSVELLRETAWEPGTICRDEPRITDDDGQNHRLTVSTIAVGSTDVDVQTCGTSGSPYVPTAKRPDCQTSDPSEPSGLIVISVSSARYVATADDHCQYRRHLPSSVPTRAVEQLVRHPGTASGDRDKYVSSFGYVVVYISSRTRSFRRTQWGSSSTYLDE